MNDVISENMGIHGPMLYIFKTLAVKNAKKLELGFSVDQLPYDTNLIYTTIFNVINIDKLPANNLLFIIKKTENPKWLPIMCANCGLKQY